MSGAVYPIAEASGTRGKNFASPFQRQRLERGPSNRDVIDMGGRLWLELQRCEIGQNP